MKACPKCASENLAINNWHAWCKDCLFEGPFGETPKDCEKAWDETEIIKNGICDACGKEDQYLLVINGDPLVNGCICRACLEFQPASASSKIRSLGKLIVDESA